MSETRDGSIASTPESVQATAQTSEASAPAPNEITGSGFHGREGTAFLIGDGVARAVEGRPYERYSGQPKSERPLYRPLKIFALDPSVSRLEGATALVNVPYEPLDPGPRGSIFSVVGDSRAGNDTDRPLNLEEPGILIRNGLDPSTSDKRFHEQMVYAVCSIVYTAFRTALGRHITWGFKRPEDKRVQLVIKPRAFEGTNSFYNKETGELCFGYYRSEAKDSFPGTVYACLSHDTVAHEVTHALLDGLRAHFSLPTSPDVPAFHEGFADLVAVFQHFSYEQVVRAAIRKSQGVISRAALLTDIARQLGQTGRESKTALRSAIDFTDEQAGKHGEPADAPNQRKSPRLYDPQMEPHDLGSVLVIAVFEAFIAVFQRKTERLLRLATNGSGKLPTGEIPYDLQAALADKASKLASQFLTMCIRAIDYCPPVDITLGEYLRAVITADKDLVPDDPWAYREAWIDAFRRYHIYPRNVDDLSEDSLLWFSPDKQQPPMSFLPIRALTFAKLRFNGDPAWPANARELRRQARALGRIVTRPEFMDVFGLARQGDKRLNGDEVALPKIQSIRSSRRVGPSGQIVFDIVAEVTQRRSARISPFEECAFYGGSTIIIDPEGRIRYVMSKSVTDNERLYEQKEFLGSPAGMRYREHLCGKDRTKSDLFMMLHREEPEEKEELTP
jgi:hypothetical protein